MSLTAVAIIIQLVFGTIIGLYFWNMLINQRTQKQSVNKESRKELEELRKLKMISLTEPLAEKVRPISFQDIVGQEDGIRSLRAALCGPNPQHVIIYGPPGVGKTAAARLVLEEAKKNKQSPFLPTAVFVELDGATARFDERGIADPLIGSVHDPIYQGAGAMGQAGIPQPKQGAVTKAHGGILFIDEIGELHSIQLNKLLKVLEDRKVMLESAYYHEENEQIPKHIHEIFQHGLPADFRLVGATTRSPGELPPALRSRCLEVYFRGLFPDEIQSIVRKAVAKINFTIDDEAVKTIAKYARNGREAVNIVQIAAGNAVTEARETLNVSDIEWVIHASRLQPRLERKIHAFPKVGLVNGLAVVGAGQGALMEIEVTVIVTTKEKGTMNVTGIVEEEQTGNQAHSVRRKSMAKGSLENVLTVLRKMGLNTDDYDIHVNFPGGTPVDGPSAGIAIAAGIYSAIKEIPINNELAMTGEVGIHGTVKAVGGVAVKVEAAIEAGAKKIIIPKANEQSLFKKYEQIEIIPVSHITDVLYHALNIVVQEEDTIPAHSQMEGTVTFV